MNMCLYYNVLFSVVAMLVAVSTSPGLCGDGNYDITLSNGNVICANSVGFTKDKLVIGFKVGEAVVDIASVDYVTSTGEKADMLQAKGDYVPGRGEHAGHVAANSNVIEPEAGEGGQGPEGMKDEAVDRHDAGLTGGRYSTRWETIKNGLACKQRVVSARPPEITDEEQKSIDRELDELYRQSFQGAGNQDQLH